MHRFHDRLGGKMTIYMYAYTHIYGNVKCHPPQQESVWEMIDQTNSNPLMVSYIILLCMYYSFLNGKIFVLLTTLF